MRKLNINKQILSDIVNLKKGVFLPITKFSSKKETISISNKFLSENNSFFSIPILFPVSLNNKKKIEKHSNLQLFFENKFVCEIVINDVFQISKNLVKKIYGFYDLKHPGIKNFFNIKNFYLDCEIKNFNKGLINKLNFNSPEIIKNKINNLSCAGFHTRNVPHRGHEWIHRYGEKICSKVLIQPMIGQYKIGEYNEMVLIKANKIAANLNKKKYIFSTFFSYPRYCGPREALLHAIVRKNYGCSHFLVGRDHAGYKDYFTKYSSQKLCKKFQKKIKIKIIDFNEPFVCKICKKVINKNCKSCKTAEKILISGTKIRKLIRSNKLVAPYLMNPKIYKKIKNNSLIR